MIAAMTAEAIGRLRASPPWSSGLSRKSPRVAPSGRVRMNAAQNNRTHDTSVQRSSDRQARGKDERSPFVAKAAGVGDPIAKGSPQRLRKRDGGPVERFHLWRGYGLDRH